MNFERDMIPRREVYHYGFKTRVYTHYKGQTIETWLYMSDEDVTEQVLEAVQKNHIQIIEQDLEDEILWHST